MVTEAHIENKPEKETRTAARRSVKVELEGQHAQNLERVAKAYGIEPDEVVAYLLEREIGPVEPIDVCVQCRMLQDRVQHQNQRIQSQRRELRNLNRAIRAGGAGKHIDQAARMAMSALDRWMDFNVAWATEGPDATAYMLAIRRVLTQFLSKSHHAWYGIAHVLGEATSDLKQTPKTLLPDVKPGDW